MKLIRKWKRRKPGVYAWRTDQHLNPMRREWGYVGESVNIGLRDLCHLGRCRHTNCKAKPWSDLRPRRHTIVRLPWWLGWKWVLRPLETLVMLALAPRYNHAKNKWNPRRIPIGQAMTQRFEREGRPAAYRAKVATAQFSQATLRFLGVLAIVVGIVGAVVTQWR
jgi:hypothetical protein